MVAILRARTKQRPHDPKACEWIWLDSQSVAFCLLGRGRARQAEYLGGDRRQPRDDVARHPVTTSDQKEFLQVYSKRRTSTSMTRFTLVFSALLVAAFPVSADLVFLNSQATRGTITSAGTSVGAFIITPTHINFQSTIIGSTDPMAPVLYPSLFSLGLPVEFFNDTFTTGIYNINPITPPPSGDVVLSTPLAWRTFFPDPRVSSPDGSIPYTVPFVEFTDVSVRITVLPPTNGLTTFKYTGSARGTDYLTGTASDLTLSGTVGEVADNVWGDSHNFLLKITTDPTLSILAKNTGGIVLPEPTAALQFAMGILGLVAFRIVLGWARNSSRIGVCRG